MQISQRPVAPAGLWSRDKLLGPIFRRLSFAGMFNAAARKFMAVSRVATGSSRILARLTSSASPHVQATSAIFFSRSSPSSPCERTSCHAGVHRRVRIFQAGARTSLQKPTGANLDETLRSLSGRFQLEKTFEHLRWGDFGCVVLLFTQILPPTCYPIDGFGTLMQIQNIYLRMWSTRCESFRLRFRIARNVAWTFALC